jgi:hypothetical protein
MIEEITVSGTVLDCPPNPLDPQQPDGGIWVDITGTVLVNGQPDPTQSVDVTAKLPVVDTGTQQIWATPLKGLPPLPCGTTVRVRAACHTNPDCFDEQDFTVNCGCAVATLSGEIARDCSPDGKRTVTFTIGLLNLSAGDPVFGTLHLGNGIAGTLSVQFDPSDPAADGWIDQGAGFTKELTFDYPPGLYTSVNYEMTFPSACHTHVPLGDGSLNILSCDTAGCPMALTLQVWLPLSDRPVFVVNPDHPQSEDDPCLRPGEYTIVVSEPDPPDGRTYTWSVNNQIDNEPGVNGVNRSTYTITIAAGTTRVVSVAVDTPNCSDIVSGSVELRACEDGDMTGDCPRASTLVVRDANNDVVPSGSDDPCLSPGDYTITVISPTPPTGRTYTWSVNGVEDSEQSGVGLDSFTHTIAASSTTAVSVEVATPNCEDTAPGSVDLQACGDGNRPEWLPEWVPEVPEWLCFIWGIVNILLLLTTAFMIAYTGCLWPVWPLWILTAALAIATAISLAMWVILCAWKPNVCVWARWLPRILALIGLVAGFLALIIGVIGALLSILVGEVTLPCFIGIIVSSVVEFAYYGLLGFAIWELLLIVGCEPLPLIELP